MIFSNSAIFRKYSILSVSIYSTVFVKDCDISFYSKFNFDILRPAALLFQCLILWPLNGANVDGSEITMVKLIKKQERMRTY